MMRELTSTHFRHPGERRDPDFQKSSMPEVWAPTFVGLTNVISFTGMTDTAALEVSL